MNLQNSTSTLPSIASALPPIRKTWEDELLFAQGAKLPELYRMAVLASGAFHVLNPKVFRDNLNAFEMVCKRHGIKSYIYFARKANKSDCWLPVVAEAGHCVDVASGEELTGALGAGIRAEDLILTGAEKSEALLTLALRQQILISADSPSELLRINSLAHCLGICNVQVLLRLLPDEQPESRFGATCAQWDEILAQLREESQLKFDCRGVTFHLNGYSASQRIRQSHAALDYLQTLRRHGWTAEILDIGGGFSIQYCSSAQWESFSSTVLDVKDKKDYFHAGRNPESVYPYGGQDKNGPEMLDEILSGVKATEGRGSGVSLAKRLRDGQFRLAIEPGRSVLDGCGLSVFPVQGVKRRADYFIVTVAGLSMSLSEQWKGSEFLPDMTLWGSPGSIAEDNSKTDVNAVDGASCGPLAMCVGGASCMEYDMLTWRKVQIERVPRIGDLLVYHNTAGYQMDKNESSFHQIRLPERFVWEGVGNLPKIDRPFYRELI